MAEDVKISAAVVVSDSDCKISDIYSHLRMRRRADTMQGFGDARYILAEFGVRFPVWLLDASKQHSRQVPLEEIAG
jgi:hypothetical protein